MDAVAIRNVCVLSVVQESQVMYINSTIATLYNVQVSDFNL